MTITWMRSGTWPARPRWLVADAKPCTKCGAVKALSEFTTRGASGKLKAQCKQCMNQYQREWRARDADRLRARGRAYYQTRKEAEREYTRAYRAANPEAVKASSRRAKLRGYGLDEEGYALILDRQEGVCAICREACATGRKLAVDHDHASGQVRGLLCSKCNKGLGLFGDSIEGVNKALAYLHAAA